jgi:hypothetical protein
VVSNQSISIGLVGWLPATNPIHGPQQSNQSNLYSLRLVGLVEWIGWWGGGVGGTGFGSSVGGVSLHPNTKNQLHLQHPQTTPK